MVVLTSSAPCASSHSPVATCRAPAGPLSGDEELIHNTMTRTVIAASPRHAANVPRTKAEASTADLFRSADNIGLRSVTWVTLAMLPTTRAYSV